MKTAYIIEDEELLRGLLRTFFATRFPDIAIVGSAGGGGAASEDCLRLAPDLVVVDIQLPEVNGLEILHLLKDRFPEVKILVFTGKVSPQAVKIALEGRADGFVNKVAGLDELEKAILACREGGRYYSPEVEEIIERMRAES
jgi:DNA-binding NarL/FixJ family response regulator